MKDIHLRGQIAQDCEFVKIENQVRRKIVSQKNLCAVICGILDVFLDFFQIFGMDQRTMNGALIETITQSRIYIPFFK